jgi:hypothetical protein
MDQKLTDLKDQFAEILCEPELLKHPDGLPTGLSALDRFLVSKGIPKGALTLFTGALGTGATSLWIDTAAQVIALGRWVAWVNGEVPLLPQSLQHRKLDLSRFVALEKPDSDGKLFFALHEMMSSGLFGLIGVDLGTATIKEHQLRKLQVKARDTGIALVVITTAPSSRKSPSVAFAPSYSVILSFEKKQIVVSRALHRPTPHILARSVSYERFTHHTSARFARHTSARSARHIVGSAHEKSATSASDGSIAIANSRPAT